MPFTCPWGTFSYRVLPFILCSAPTTFQHVVLGIFVDLIHETMEAFMDDFTSHGGDFDEALNNLEKVLTRYKEFNLCLSNEKMQNDAHIRCCFGSSYISIWYQRRPSKK